MTTIFLSKKEARDLGLIPKKKESIQADFSKVRVRLIETAIVSGVTAAVGFGVVAYQYLRGVS